MAIESKMLSIPREVIQEILTCCSATDVAAFSQTCSYSRDLVYSSDDSYLWRELLIHEFGDPRDSLAHRTIEGCDNLDWKATLQRRIRAEHIAFHPKSPDDLAFAVQTFLDIVRTSEPYSERRHSPSTAMERLSIILSSSSILHRSFPNHPASLDQAIAQLKAYFILSHVDDEDEPLPSEHQRNKSRCFAYDLSNYTRESRWGPYLADGGVNWIHVVHLMNVVWANLGELPLRMFEFRPRVGLDAVRARSAPAKFSDTDWAGVEGDWRRYVCFMDYRDLFAFNYSNTFRGPKNIAYFEENPRFREATRLIQVKLKVVSHAELKYHEEFCTYFPNYPPIHFKGTSRGVNGNESSVEGVVRMADDGSIRYHFREKVSLYDGETQWSSEGIQVGNVGCAAGVVGVWTTVLHDRGDPVGPFWLWKVDEEYPVDVFDHL